MRTAAVVTAFAALALVEASGQEPLAALLARTAAYVDAYQRDFALIVSEERYEQEVVYPAPSARGREIRQRQVLRSDFLLVHSHDSWVPFRDVFEVDGRPVRDREDRLAKLFLNDSVTALEQARTVADESARLNIGNVDRNINLPTLALIFITDPYRDRFMFEDRGRDDDVRVVRFTERATPTYVTTTGGRDLPLSGRYWIEPATGRIERTELVASDPAIEARITVTYRPDDSAGLWVPARMEEEYKQRLDRSEIRGIATYSRFRHFQVTTQDDLAR